MAGLTASVDTTKTPLELTVELSDALAARRSLHVEVTLLGETAVVDTLFPITVTDAERTWALKTNGDRFVVYTATA